LKLPVSDFNSRDLPRDFGKQEITFSNSVDPTSSWLMVTGVPNEFYSPNRNVYINKICRLCLVGGLNPSEKHESHLGLLFPIYGKIKNVPNHQPVVVFLSMVT
jgi:hypothetical protein